MAAPRDGVTKDWRSISRSRSSFAAILDTVTRELDHQEYTPGVERTTDSGHHNSAHPLPIVSSEKRKIEGNGSFADRGIPGIPHPQAHQNHKLFTLLDKIDRLDLFPKMLDAEVTDLWLPLPRRLLRKWLNDADTRAFVELQESLVCEEDDCFISILRGKHYVVESMDHLHFDRVKHLGAGGFGDVWHVKNPEDGQAYACKTMARPVRFDAHAVLMRNFKREITGMRRVQHRHCVDLVASGVDMDSVMILSSPVADMDLAEFLNADLSLAQLVFLRQSIGCITSALAYLHSIHIRWGLVKYNTAQRLTYFGHDDFKPNNILIHGTNILLTDFGFCLDSSDTGITTTAGPPTHSTRRYSAPEVFNHSQRSRLTDIWSLGCVLADIISRIFGHKLDDLRAFWSSNGVRIDSYAENPDATSEWLSYFASSIGLSWRTEVWLVVFIKDKLLARERLQRPTAQQVFDCLAMRPDRGHPLLGACCRISTEIEAFSPETLSETNANTDIMATIDESCSERTDMSEKLAVFPLDPLPPRTLRTPVRRQEPVHLADSTNPDQPLSGPITAARYVQKAKSVTIPKNSTAAPDLVHISSGKRTPPSSLPSAPRVDLAPPIGGPGEI